MARKKWKQEELRAHFGVKAEALPYTIMNLLNLYETVDRLVDHLKHDEGIEVSRETIDRMMEANKIKPFQCWRPVVDATFTGTVSTKAVVDSEGKAQ